MHCVGNAPKCIGVHNALAKCKCIAGALHCISRNAAMHPVQAPKRALIKQAPYSPPEEQAAKRKKSTCAICGPFSNHTTAAQHEKAVTNLHAMAETEKITYVP